MSQARPFASYSDNALFGILASLDGYEPQDPRDKPWAKQREREVKAELEHRKQEDKEAHQ